MCALNVVKGMELNMRKKVWIIVGILIVVIGIIVIGVWTSQANEQKMNQVAGVSIKIKEGTLTNTGATIIITDATNKNYSYGEPYRIDKKENGKWKEAPKVIDDAFFNMPAYQPDENNEIVREINWEWIYGKLTPGTYRFVTNASDENISVTFVIK